jgi:hypothetical protein
VAQIERGANHGWGGIPAGKELYLTVPPSPKCSRTNPEGFLRLHGSPLDGFTSVSGARTSFGRNPCYHHTRFPPGFPTARTTYNQFPGNPTAVERSFLPPPHGTGQRGSWAPSLITGQQHFPPFNACFTPEPRNPSPCPLPRGRTTREKTGI